ncbi:MAG: hypothetical protein HYY23_03010, partial [Verrucomicrobia bacterium]|nr:hypothetical protein [Verrucomicrobiota bacterium]
MNEDNRAARILARPSARLFFLFCLLIAASFPWPGAQGALFFSGIPNQIVAEDTPTQPLSFTIFGGQGAITVAGSSDNTELIRIENIRITPLANDLWHVVVEPSTNQFGTATITLTARDSLNAIGSRSFPITVQPVNDPPIVRLLSPIPGKYAADLSIPISAEATDVEGALRSVELFLSRIEGTTATLTNSLATITSSPFNYTLQSVTTGFYDLWAKATDGGGSVSESPRVRIEVSRTPVPPPNYVQLLEGDSSAGSRRSFLVPILAFSYTNSVTLSYSTQSGSAIEGIDFQPLSNSTVVLDPGKITAPITNLVIYGNPVDDSPFRSFYLNWNGPNGVQLLANSTEIRILDDDEPPVVTISDAQQIIEGNPGTTNLVSFTLSLSSESHQPVFVEFATTGEGTATAGTDYSAVTEEDIDTNSIRIDPGFTTGQIKIQVVGDTLDEFDESFFVRLINASNATLDPVKNQARAIILDDDAPPTLSIFPTEVVEGNDGPTNAVFTASLSAPSGHPITAQYATTTDGTAASGVDFRSASGTLTFQPGETSKTVIVEVVGDTLHEGTETFFVALSNPTNASIAIPQAQGRIFDDEAAPVVSIQDAVAVLEGNTGTVNATFQVSLSAASAQAVTVVVATADATAIAGVDYTARTNTVAFNPGSPLTQTVSVDIRGDNLSEPDETFFVNLSDPVGATLGRNQATGTIKDDDPTPTISVFTTSVVEGNGTTNAVFDVRLSSPSGLSVAVSFATTNGTAIADSDYRPTQASVSFSPGETNQTIRIPVIGDAIHEDNETFLVRLSLPQNATIAIGEAEATILDDDPLPTISIQDTAVGEGNSGITNAVFLLTLSAPSGIPVSVGFSTANDSAVVDQDYNRAEGTLTFNSGQTNLTLSVAARGDLMNEAEEAFWVRLSSPTNATLARAEAKGIIVDDDPFPVLSIDDTAVLEGNAGATNAVFNVNLSVASGQTVTVSYATVDGTATAPREYSAASGTLTFAPGETTKTINVPVNGDTEDEPNETFLLRLSNPSHLTIQDAEAQAVIINDDVVPSLTIRDVSVTEGNSSTTNAVFLVALSQPSGRTVTVEFHTADGTATAGQDYSALTNKLTFNPGQTNHSISIAVSPETLHEANEVFFVNLVNPENATIAQKQARCAIVDDDPPPAILIGDVSIAEGDTGTKKATFSVRLAAPSGQGASVEFATTNGTAVAFADYLPAFGTLSFAPGETNATINVEIIGDIINESAEEFLVQLANPVNATITKGLGQCRITDDDPVPTLSINDVSVTEGDAGLSRAVFEIKLSAPGGQRITVKYAAVEETASAATDFVAQSSTLIFNPGETNKRITILVNGDTFFEPSETFSVNLSTPVNATITRGQGQATILDDDSEPAISINDLAVIEGSTGTTEAVFTVSLSVASLKTVSVDFAAAAQTATAGSDYVEQSGTLSFKPGETTKPVAIAIHGDLIDEPDEAFVINLSNAANATLAKAQGRGTITNDDETPSIIIRDATFVEGKSETTNVLVNVSLSAASSQRVTLAFTTTNGTATAFSDYKPSSGLLIFEPGETNKTITVEILGDDLHEPEEYLFVELASATHARLTSTQLKLLINDDDPLPVISIRDLTIAEGNDQPRKALFEVTLSSASSEEVTVDFASADETAIAGKDYFSAAGTLTFRSGQTFETIAVAVSADSARESNESFKVILSNPKNATLARSVAVGTILDDDSVPTLSINDISVIEGHSGTVNAVFALTLSAPSGETVSVNYATRDGTAAAGSDYQTQSGTVAFSPGETSKAIAVPVLGDLVNEPDEVFVLNLIQPVNATISRGQGTGTIRDDDPLPAISISDTAVTEGHSGTTNAEFVVTLSGPSGQLVTVDFSTSDGTATAGSDYEPRTSGQLTFKPGETRQTIAVAVIGEAVPEAEEFFLVRLSSPTQATILDGEAVGTITDDDKSVGISITDAAVLEPDTGTTNLVFIVSLSAPSSQLVSVAYATLDNTAQAGGDYASAFGSLTFLPGTTNQTLAVQVRGDTANEDDESFFVRLSAPTNAVILDNRAIGTITDNDRLPTISIADSTVTEGNSGTLSADFTVTLSAPSAKIVSVNFTTVEGTATAGRDFQLASDTLTFLPGTTTRTISVPVIGDTDDEPNETFAVVLNRPVNATLENSRALGTILNDDVLPTLLITDASVREGNVGTSFAEFTVRLSTPSTQAVKVSFNTANRTAIAGSDYQEVRGELTLAAGASTNVVRVPILGDATVEPNETFEVRLSNAN